MDPVTLLLDAIRRDPADDLAWLALADGLEEAGQADRAELMRLTRRLLVARSGKGRPALEQRLRELLAAGVRPCMPELTNSVGMRFVLIPPGVFRMGSGRRDRGADSDEMPSHQVEIPHGFWMGVLPVTVAEYRRVSRGKRWQFEGDARPAHGISHMTATRFCSTLTRRAAEKKAGRVYRLPTEAEWEYACRAGTTTHFHLGDRITSAVADVAAKYEDGPRPGGSFPPNAFGLFDMHGGVYQWCADEFDPTCYRHAPRVSPFVAPSSGGRGGSRVLRSACWVDREDACRSASRNQAGANDSSVYLGLRLCFDEV